MRLVLVLSVVLSASACGERPTLRVGERCSLNSDCETPLICRLERCRRECAGTRDCAVGSMCVLDEDGVGICQVEQDRDCTLNSDCPSPLVCRFGHCTNECVSHDDCGPGARCLEQDGGATGCMDPADQKCVHHSDCRADQFCAVDGRCREQCLEDRDCLPGARCLGEPGARVCAPPGDAGLDAGG